LPAGRAVGLMLALGLGGLAACATPPLPPAPAAGAPVAGAGAPALEPLEVPQPYWTLAGTQAGDRSSVAYNVALVYRQIALDLRTGSARAPSLADALLLHRRLDAIERAAAAR